MHVAYCMAKYPCRSERFIQREIDFLRSRNVAVTVWALRKPPLDELDAELVHIAGSAVYRPARWSGGSLGAIGWLLSARLSRLMALLVQVLALFVSCPRSALKLLANLHTVAVFARQAEREGVTQIHGCFLNLPGLVAMAVATITELPFTVAGHARDVFVEGQATALLAREAACVIVCHPSAAEALRSRFRNGLADRIHLVCHGLGTQRACDRPGEGPTRPTTILAAGRFVPKKGFEVLIRASSLLKKRGLAFNLVLAGDGPDRARLNSLARQCDVGDRLRLPGWRSEAALRCLLDEATLAVVPSIVAADGDRDGIPNLLFEAWAAEVPVVASDLPAVRWAADHGVHAWLVEPADEAALAIAIEKLLNDAPLRRCLATAGRQRLAERFSLDRNGETLIGLLERANRVQAHG